MKMKIQHSGKWSDPLVVRATSSNETTIQKYMSFVNFEVIQEKMNYPNYVSTLSQQAYPHYSLQSPNDNLPFCVQLDARSSLKSLVFLPAFPKENQASSTKFQVLQFEKKQEIFTREDSRSTVSNADLYHFVISVIDNVLQGFIKTLSKTLNFNVHFSLFCERIGLKVELKTNVKCD
jgi:hypothetical protein